MKEKKIENKFNLIKTKGEFMRKWNDIQDFILGLEKQGFETSKGDKERKEKLREYGIKKGFLKKRK